MFLKYNKCGSVENWGVKFVKCHIGLTHTQWLYRNSEVHYVINDLTVLQHRELAAKMGQLMRTKRMALLARHRPYMKIDFAELRHGPMIARQVWVTNMEMAIGIAKVAKGNFCTWESLRLLCTKIVLPVIQKCSPTPPANVPPTDNSFPFNRLLHLLMPISSYQKPQSSTTPCFRHHTHHNFDTY